MFDQPHYQCSVCSASRPAAELGVVHREISIIGIEMFRDGFHGKSVLRLYYCNDNPSCQEGIQQIQPLRSWLE